MHFFLCAKKSPLEAVDKDYLKVAGKYCDENDDDVMKFIL